MKNFSVYYWLVCLLFFAGACCDDCDDVVCDSPLFENCGTPGSLDISNYDESLNTVQLEWENIGANSYELIYFHPDGSEQVSSTTNTNITLALVAGGGEHGFIVFSECEAVDDCCDPAYCEGANVLLETQDTSTTCNAFVTNVDVDNITATSMDITWLGHPDAVSYEILIVTPTDTLQSAETDLLTFQTSGFDPTAFEMITLYVKPDCGEDKYGVGSITDIIMTIDDITEIERTCNIVIRNPNISKVMVGSVYYSRINFIKAFCDNGACHY